MFDGFDLNDKFIVKLADTNDASKIHSLIKELADFQKMPDKFVLSVEQLALDLKKNFVQSFLILYNDRNDQTKNEAVAVALFYNAYSSFQGQYLFLEDIYVKEKYRRQGLGKALFQCLARLAFEKKMKRIEWNVLNWNENADKFYKSFGSVNLTKDEGWQVCRLFEDQIKKLANE